MRSQKTNPVSMDGFDFTPRELTIKVGEAVEWTNSADPDWHSATHKPAAGENRLFDSPDLFAGDPPFSFTFNTAGQYEYFCRNHQEMQGKIKVE
jgi:plastocyanin